MSDSVCQEWQRNTVLAVFFNFCCTTKGGFDKLNTVLWTGLKSFNVSSLSWEQVQNALQRLNSSTPENAIWTRQDKTLAHRQHTLAEGGVCNGLSCNRPRYHLSWSLGNGSAQGLVANSCKDLLILFLYFETGIWESISGFVLIFLNASFGQKKSFWVERHADLSRIGKEVSMDSSQNPADSILVAIGDILNWLGVFGLQNCRWSQPTHPLLLCPHICSIANPGQ